MVSYIYGELFKPARAIKIFHRMFALRNFQTHQSGKNSRIEYIDVEHIVIHICLYMYICIRLYRKHLPVRYCPKVSRGGSWCMTRVIVTLTERGRINVMLIINRFGGNSHFTYDYLKLGACVRPFYADFPSIFLFTIPTIMYIG